MRSKHISNARERRKQSTASEGLLCDEDVEQDADAVGRAIAKHLRLQYAFRKRGGGGSGLKVGRHRIGNRSPKPSGPSPKPRSSASTLPREGEADV